MLGEGLAKGYVTAADRDEYLQAWSQPGALTGGLNYYRAARVGPPSRDGAPASGTLGVAESATVVSVPTLVIWGEQDTALLTGNLEGLDGYVPALTVRRIPEGSHWVIHEQPDRINGLIRDYLRAGDLPQA